MAGNVKNIHQWNVDRGLHKINYEYDQGSGKVNFVAYQHGEMGDRFYYRYKYDKDNRLSQVLTGTSATYYDFLSQPGFILDEKTDATYQYYMHGPLARVEIGENKVQGLDYIYTLQGWLKGINGHRLNVAIDAGRDSYAGTDRATVARDVMAYTLGYFSGDYQPVGGASANAFPMTFNNSTAATGKDLFNGNISHTTVALSRFNSGAPNAYTYKYDQLNRLVDMRQHPLTISTTTWTHSASMNYAESISYDANGNIKTYLRNGANITNMPLAMDNLTYNYTYANDPVTGVPYLVNNKLTHVSDQAASTEYSNTKNATSDIDNQQSANYTYDKIGNLISDVQEGIEKITWNVYGKIDRIKKAGTDYIQYGYDPSGNRVYKEVSTAGVVTKNWYVRDAQGNALALYSDKKNGQPGMWWNEQTLYGSSRLGVWKPSVNLQSASGGSVWNTIGLKQYELTNHLGNVLTAITDKKLPHDNGSGVIDYYQAETVSATDYYAFGMPMPGRNFSSSTYRYGFNGKENDNDVKGNGNQQDYGMRIYDPRLGRFLSVDPLTKDFPWNSTYAFAENDVISSIDLEGLEKYKVVGRSFAPRGSFATSHFESRADDRTKFQIADYRNVSARIHTLLNINLDTWSMAKRISTQPTILKGGSSWDAKNMKINAEMFGSIGEKNFTIKGDYWSNNGTNIGPGIDIQFNYTLQRPDDNTLTVATNIFGNTFPAQETMIFDQKGTGIFMGVSTATGGPLTGVWGSGEKNRLSYEFMKVQTDKEGNFLGVYSKDKQGNDIVINPDSYNKKFSDKKVWDQQEY